MSKLGIPSIEQTECNIIIGVKCTDNGYDVETQMDDGEQITALTLKAKKRLSLADAVIIAMHECEIRHIKASNLL